MDRDEALKHFKEMSDEAIAHLIDHNLKDRIENTRQNFMLWLKRDCMTEFETINDYWRHWEYKTWKQPKDLKAIEIDVYIPHDTKPGYLKFVRRKTVQEVFKELREAMALMGIDPELGEYFHIRHEFNQRYLDHQYSSEDALTNAPEFPRYHNLAVFPVTGTNEGHYIHVETIQGTDRKLIYIGKTFHGWEYAWKASQTIARLLGA